MEEKNLQKETTPDMRDKIYRFLMKAVAVFAMSVGIIMFCMTAKATAATVVPPYKYGDVNHKGVIDITDQLKVARHINASSDQSVYVKHPDWILTGNTLKAADVNYDGKITSANIDLIVQHIAAKKSTPGNLILTVTLVPGDSGTVYRCLPCCL